MTNVALPASGSCTPVSGNCLRISALLFPGLAETEFSQVRFHGDEHKAKQVYMGMTPLKGDDIADLIHFAATRPPHVCINDLVVMPTAQAASTLVHRKS